MADLGLDKIIGYLIGGAFAYRGIVGFVYGPSRPDRADQRAEHIERLIKEANDRSSKKASDLQATMSTLELTVREHTVKIDHHAEEIRLLREGSGSHRIRKP